MSALRAEEREIVVEIIDGTADASHVHIAAPGPASLAVVRTLCGTEGSLYVKTGPFAQSPWCDQCLALDTLPERTATMAIATATCKIDDCNNPAEDAGGPYARMCLKHKQAAQESRRSSPPIRSSVPGTGYVDRVRALVPAARALDKAKRKLAASGTSESLKATFDEAMRRANGVPTTENLERLEQAAKKLRRGGAGREKATASYQEAVRTFKVGLAELARDFRA